MNSSKGFLLSLWNSSTAQAPSPWLDPSMYLTSVKGDERGMQREKKRGSRRKKKASLASGGAKGETDGMKSAALWRWAHGAKILPLTHSKKSNQGGSGVCATTLAMKHLTKIGKLTLSSFLSLSFSLFSLFFSLYFFLAFSLSLTHTFIPIHY